MVGRFQNRLAQAERLEKPFIASMSAECTTHQIVKFGIESTELRRIHEYIQLALDSTSQFVRYLPDSVLVSKAPILGIPRRTTLLEFKVQDTLVQQDTFFQRILAEHFQRNQNTPPLANKEDIFSLEKASLDLYQQLAIINVAVVVVAWQTRRTRDADTIRAQYADQVVTCQVQTPQQTSGSGTVISNVHFGAFVPVQAFFEQELGVASSVLDAVVAHVRRRTP